ncbi:putative Multi-sensor hybrid histidine kinase [Desulfamplus magnetovallimortis]|uniref:histidine kinase n=1 Tax=Desulfamplus magnetovallimortis TaxID=1246637 RepID=A0A1W1HHE2_9BACT|nr:transporter substrate-binding domain-containing protein [Desulfamplus magnetovallimortis]SLM31917.1 putative Multi-sensor hybrid histidine kinase [Desulfamplus magnetovallimortis]
MKYRYEKSILKKIISLYIFLYTAILLAFFSSHAITAVAEESDKISLELVEIQEKIVPESDEINKNNNSQSFGKSEKSTSQSDEKYEKNTSPSVEKHNKRDSNIITFTLEDLDLSPSENEWLHNNKTITVSGPRSFPPFYFLSNKNELSGISVDFLHAIMKPLGIKLIIRKNIPWQEVLEETKAGNIDLVACIAKTRERESFLRFSKPFLSFPLVIITRVDAPFTGGIFDLAGKKVTTIKKTITSEWLRRDGIDIIPHYAASPLDGLKAVSFGEAHAQIENLAAATYLIAENGLTNLKVAAPTPYENYNLHIAVRKDLEELGAIIDKAINVMPDVQQTEIRNKWLSVRYEYGISTTDIIKWVLMTVIFSGSILTVVLIWNKKLQKEIKERKESDAALRESGLRLRTLINSMTDIVCFKDGDGRWLEVNDVYLKLFDLESADFRGRKNSEIAMDYPVLKDTFRVCEKTDAAAWQAGGISRGNEVIQLPGDNTKIFDVVKTVTFDNKGNRKSLVLVGRDITEKTKMEQQLQHSQRFEAIGTLAGGIAHDFNNLLMAIKGRSSLILMELEAYSPHWKHLKAIEEYIRNATDLTRQLIGLAQGGKYEIKPIYLNNLVQESSSMFGRTKKEISIKTGFCSPSPVVEVDVNQLKQVLLNIYINAWQAMPNGGDLIIETRIITLDTLFCTPYKILPGKYATLSISDTGTGMNKSICERIFDPFFTTKEKGRGTGLGLASAYGIIRNHSGIITVYSEEGKGSTFNIYLPLSNMEAVNEHNEETRVIKGCETILMIDDEEMILEVGEALLEKLGYKVIIAEGGEDAIDILKSKGDVIDLIILDLIMPGMDGRETFENISKIRPEIPVMLSSGYSVQGQASDLMEKGCKDFIQKPFDISELSGKIRKLLDNLP